MEEVKNENKLNNASNVAAVVERNIKALVERRRKEEQEKPLRERIADTITRFTGNMAFVYSHAIVFGIWILLNLEWGGIKPFDPDFVGLQLFTAIEAIFLSTFVLMSQNSLDAQADNRADLDLQISLLAEHEITRLLTLVTAIANKLEISEAQNPEIDELAKDVMPEKVMESVQDHKDNGKTL
jgi:uncharacterized membrane protein